MTPQDFKQRRKDLGYTQAELAQLLGISTRQVQYYESGEQRVTRVVELALGTLRPKRRRRRRPTVEAAA